MMETVTCNLCGSEVYRVIYHISDWLLNRPAVMTTLVECQSCGLIYQNPRPSFAEMGQHYPMEYEPFQQNGKRKTSWLIRKAVEYGFDNRAHAISRYKESGLLLDIGCATGDFLNHMQQKYGWQVRGVEVSEYAAKQARTSYSLDVFTGTVEQANFPENYFDGITMWDVLEHLHDPAKTLKEIYRIIKPGGILAFRVPNGDSFDLTLFGPYWAGLDSPRHLYVFKRSTVAMLLKKNGFDILKMTSRHASYMGTAISLRMWMTGQGWKPATREWITRFIYHPITRLAFAPVFFVYGLTERAAQLMVIARVNK